MPPPFRRQAQPALPQKVLRQPVWPFLQSAGRAVVRRLLPAFLPAAFAIREHESAPEWIRRLVRACAAPPGLRPQPGWRASWRASRRCRYHSLPRRRNRIDRQTREQVFALWLWLQAQQKRPDEAHCPRSGQQQPEQME
ncbi:hypothetical protein [Brucella sp. 458]|uniref:effector-associated domain 2-containing protein n=1 Tax=Brucella sp. 458 TaxID=2821140 RepID=UPI00352FFC44